MRTFLPGFVLLLMCTCGPADSRRTLQPDPLAESPIEKESGAVAIRRAEPVAAQANCQYDNAASILGMGLILTPKEFTIYNDASLQDVFAVVDLYADDEGLDGICPKFYGPEYGIMHFVCLDSTASAYKILTDYSSVKYVSKTANAEFITWTGYILGSFGVRRLRQEGRAVNAPPPIRREPSESSPSLAIPGGLEMFCPMEVRGEWVKVKYDCFYNREQNPHEGEPCYNFINECAEPITGWLRWRNENALLIDIFLMP